MVNSVNYIEEFETEDDLPTFKEFIKQKKGTINYRLYSEFAGKSTHIASSISLKYFDSDLRKRLIKTVL
jgi:hypothetical protein